MSLFLLIFLFFNFAFPCAFLQQFFYFFFNENYLNQPVAVLIVFVKFRNNRKFEKRFTIIYPLIERATETPRIVAKNKLAPIQSTNVPKLWNNERERISNYRKIHLIQFGSSHSNHRTTMAFLFAYVFQVRIKNVTMITNWKLCHLLI